MPDPPSLRQLSLSADPAAWAALGFEVQGASCRIADVELELTGGGEGIVAWTLAGDPGGGEVDGLATRWAGPGAITAAGPHPNGAVRLDHVVVLTDSLDRTTGALHAIGLEVRRIREAGAGRRQAFLWLGRRQVLLEVVEAPGSPPGAARFWGLTVVVGDLDAAAGRLGPALGAARAAVQPGRRIATVRREAGLGVPVALITPHGPAPSTE